MGKKGIKGKIITHRIPVFMVSFVRNQKIKNATGLKW
jgi:hypothetical protein